MTIDLSQFYQVFFEEADELLSTMERLLLDLDVANPTPDDLDAIFRAAHSIKGGAGTFGFTDMIEVTHVLENLLDRLRKKEMPVTDSMVSAFLEAGDVIRMQLDGHRIGADVRQEEVTRICARLAELTRAGAPTTQQTAAPATDPGYGFFTEEAAPEVIPTGAPAVQAREDVATDPGYGFFAEEAAPEIIPTGVPGVQDQEPPAQLAQQPAEPAAQPAPLGATADSGKVRRGQEGASGSAETSIRVSVEKVDQLINLVGELVITQAMLTQSAHCLGENVFEAMQGSLHQLERNSRDLQEVIMSVRMLPMSFVFSRFPRMVRDLAAKLGKQVELKILGEGTELDKGVIEKIIDPLTHLIRNSLDHGIETEEKRQRAGKALKGTVTLNAFHQGGNIVVEVSDDGAGLDRARILAKAREQGLGVREEMTDQEVWALIFEAGFSTAEAITDVSGRGVGMDVVKRNISALGGRIEIHSVAGLGSRFSIRLPLTMAILDGLSVGVGQQIYIIPLSYIVESMQLTAQDQRSISCDGHLIHVRGEYVPLVPLRALFPLSGEDSADSEQPIVVIIEAENRKIALQVDELLGQHQVVIKSLESNFRKLAGVSGATIMGDGRVALILDVMALMQAPGQKNQLSMV